MASMSGGISDCAADAELATSNLLLWYAIM